jgi:Ca-activated chloride channel family protein
MLNYSLTLNREFVSATQTHQKLFAMLKLRPKKEVATASSPVNFVCLIDTSGSMYEVIMGDVKETGRKYSLDGRQYSEVSGGISKIDLVIESLSKLINSGKFKPEDRIAIIRFDDEASILLDLTPASHSSQIEEAIQQLRLYSGGTRLGLGMREALNLLSSQSMATQRVLLFTDGQTFDEDLCKEIAPEFSFHNIPISALAVGDYEEDLLIHLSDNTAGNLYHIVPPESASGTQISITDLPNKILSEFATAQQEVITNLALSVKTVQGVKLSRIARVYPSLSEFSLDQDPHRIGNLVANDETVFILEFDIEKRSASRVRIAQLGLTYDIPFQKHRGEMPPQNIVVQFVEGQMEVQFDKEVMAYVQQLNIGSLVKQSTDLIDTNPEKAQELLETAARMTRRIGNEPLTESLNQAQEQLRKTRKLSPEFRKTVKVGAKGKTVRIQGDINEQFSEETIRQITGT